MQEEKTICVYCGSENIRKFGSRNGKPRLLCKDCGRTWSVGVKSRLPVPQETIELALKLLGEGHTYRAISKELGVSIGSIQWALKKQKLNKT